MRRLLASGAVPDTWAPNGSSALMLAAAANGTDALKVLLEAGATLELQDALGRSALMFAAGNTAADSLVALLNAGGWAHVCVVKWVSCVATMQSCTSCVHVHG